MWFLGYKLSKGSQQVVPGCGRGGGWGRWEAGSRALPPCQPTAQSHGCPVSSFEETFRCVGRACGSQLCGQGARLGLQRCPATSEVGREVGVDSELG